MDRSLAERPGMRKSNSQSSRMVAVSFPMEAPPALEAKLREAKGAKELDCPPDFFTEPLDE
jgi:hypothetical protein